jgi:hypothetical protein
LIPLWKLTVAFQDDVIDSRSLDQFLFRQNCCKFVAASGLLQVEVCPSEASVSDA